MLELPIATEELIPHRLPMRLVDRLLEVDGKDGVVEACVNADNLLIDQNGMLEDIALVELLAQGYAALKGYLDRSEGKAVKQGFLVGIKSIEAHRRVKCGERLLVEINTLMELDDFAVATGRIRVESELVATGEIKVWIH